MQKLSDLFYRWMTSARAPWIAAAVAMLLTAPSLWSGFQLDDYSLAHMARQGAPAWDFFNFSRFLLPLEFKEVGVLGWWAADDLYIHFFRPLSSLTHALDFAVWPNAAWLMHAENVALYGLMVFFAALIFRRVCAAPAAVALAAIFFAIDDVHMHSAAWISGRNTMLATTFGFAAVWAHVRWRQDRWRAGAFVAPALFVAALLSAEAGLACGAYLFAHALCLERGSLVRRLPPFLPYVAIFFVWRVAYVMLGCGVAGTGLYRDIGGDPLGFARSVLRAICVMSPAQLTLPVAGWLCLTPRAWLIGAGLLALLSWLLWPLLRRDPVARFFALGMLCGTMPFGATIPFDRLLLAAGLGGAGLVAQLLAALKAGELTGGAQRWTGRALWFFAGPFSLLMFLPSIFLLDLIEKPARALTDAVPDRENVVIVNAPMELILLYPSSIRDREGGSWPAHVYPLFTGPGTLVVERTGERELELRPHSGWLNFPIDCIMRAPDRPFRVGDKVELERMTVEVLEIAEDGRPLRARFRFDRDLDEFAWVGWDRNGPEAWQPPAPGKRAELKVRSWAPGFS